jgi:hypothetical protein
MVDKVLAAALVDQAAQVVAVVDHLVALHLEVQAHQDKVILV